MRTVLMVTASLLSVHAAAASPRTVSENAFACTNWAGWHEYTLASLTPRGGRFSKYCPIRIGVGAKVDLLDTDESGAATITYKGRTWIIDTDRLK